MYPVLAFAKGDYWKKRRRMISPAFTASKLKLVSVCVCVCVLVWACACMIVWVWACECECAWETASMTEGVSTYVYVYYMQSCACMFMCLPSCVMHYKHSYMTGGWLFGYRYAWYRTNFRKPTYSAWRNCSIKLIFSLHLNCHFSEWTEIARTWTTPAIQLTHWI